MFKMLSRTGVISVSLVMSACATLPELPYNAVETADIVVNIKCELQNALLTVDPMEKNFKGWTVASSLSLRQDHDGSLSADGSLIRLLIPQVFSISGGLGISGTGQRTERIDFDDTLEGLRENRSLPCRVGENPDRLRLLGGNLGMVDLLERSATSINKGGLDVSQLDYVIAFVIEKSGSLDASFRMIPVGSRGTGMAGGMWQGSRTQTHSLTLNFKPPPDKKDCSYKLVDPSAKKAHLDRINKLCPGLVVAVNVSPSTVGKSTDRTVRSQEAVPTGAPTAAPTTRIETRSRGRRRGVSPAQRRALDSARTRGLLQGTQEQLRIDGLTQ